MQGLIEARVSGSCSLLVSVVSEAALVPMPPCRPWATAYAVTSGAQVVILALGGNNAAIESFNPSNNTWTTVGALITPRVNFAAVPLDDGTVGIHTYLLFVAS